MSRSNISYEWGIKGSLFPRKARLLKSIFYLHNTNLVLYTLLISQILPLRLLLCPYSSV